MVRTLPARAPVRYRHTTIRDLPIRSRYRCGVAVRRATNYQTRNPVLNVLYPADKIRQYKRSANGKRTRVHQAAALLKALILRHHQSPGESAKNLRNAARPSIAGRFCRRQRRAASELVPPVTVPGQTLLAINTDIGGGTANYLPFDACTACSRTGGRLLEMTVRARIYTLINWGR